MSDMLNVKGMDALDEENLTEVTGGDLNFDGHHFFGHVGKYDGVVGETYFVVMDDESCWYFGKLLRTYESDVIFGFTERRHEVECWQRNGEYYNQNKNFCGDRVTLYKYMD